eukprot:NODE_175_length_15885_cov_0.420563.p8 type:complete len:199 gc:universal NODE_175_length_15885_cov_0.420563:14790-15386(+)
MLLALLFGLLDRDFTKDMGVAYVGSITSNYMKVTYLSKLISLPNVQEKVKKDSCMEKLEKIPDLSDTIITIQECHRYLERLEEYMNLPLQRQLEQRSSRCSRDISQTRKTVKQYELHILQICTKLIDINPSIYDVLSGICAYVKNHLENYLEEYQHSKRSDCNASLYSFGIIKESLRQFCISAGLDKKRPTICVDATL